MRSRSFYRHNITIPQPHQGLKIKTHAEIYCDLQIEAWGLRAYASMIIFASGYEQNLLSMSMLQLKSLHSHQGGPGQMASGDCSSETWHCCSSGLGLKVRSSHCGPLRRWRCRPQTMPSQEVDWLLDHRK